MRCGPWSVGAVRPDLLIPDHRDGKPQGRQPPSCLPGPTYPSPPQRQSLPLPLAWTNQANHHLVSRPAGSRSPPPSFEASLHRPGPSSRNDPFPERPSSGKCLYPSENRSLGCSATVVVPHFPRLNRFSAFLVSCLAISLFAGRGRVLKNSAALLGVANK